MAIKHTIRNAKGELVEVELSRKKAIRCFCVECKRLTKIQLFVYSADLHEIYIPHIRHSCVSSRCRTSMLLVSHTAIGSCWFPHVGLP